MHLLLRSAADLRRQGQESEAVLTALRAAWTFISRFDTGVRENLLAPLMKLTSALTALEEGTVDPLLKPKRKPKGGRTPDTWERQGVVGWAVGAAHRLQWTGLTPTQADREVAAALQRLGVRPARGATRKMTHRTVRDWRKGSTRIRILLPRKRQARCSLMATNHRSRPWRRSMRADWC